MIIRLYIDEDAMRRDLVQALRSRGVDVITATDADMIARPDEQHLTLATQQGRVLYSYNVGDYYQLHTAWLARGQSHAGLILADQSRYATGEQLRRLLKLIALTRAEDMTDQVVFLNAWR